MRGLMVGAVVTIVTLFFTHLHVHNLCRDHRAVLLSSIVFSLGGMINAIFAKNFDQISVHPDVRADAAHLSRRRVLLDSSCCRRGRRSMSHANPILYMVNAFRYGFLGVSDVDIRFAYTHDDRRSGGAVRRVRVAAAAGRRDPGMGVEDEVCPHELLLNFSRLLDHLARPRAASSMARGHAHRSIPRLPAAIIRRRHSAVLACTGTRLLEDVHHHVGLDVIGGW